jgi:hypothetical protein
LRGQIVLCNFDALGQNKQKRSVYKAISILLVVLILSVFAVPVLHANHNEAPTRRSGKEIVTASKKCLTCSVLSHHQHQKYLISINHPLVVPVRAYIILLQGVFAGVFKLTLPGFSNKGPPSLLSA